MLVGVTLVSTYVLLWLRRWYKSEARQIRGIVQSISADAIVNVFIPDGVEGEIHIDHLLLTQKGLLVLDVKSVTGKVFAGAQMDIWTAMDNGQRVTFSNPLPNMQDRVAAVTRLAPGTPIESHIVFNQRATFPKGHPSSVITWPELVAAYSTTTLDANNNDFATHWQAIKTVATQN